MKANLFVSLGIVFTFALLASAFGQGALTPPGPPGPTMLTLSQVEPRTPILSLPFTITNSGSYFLTTNLTGVSGYNGITILTNNVTIDLRGFTVFGVPGSESGIWVPGGTVNFTLENGTVCDWPFSGVDADDGFDSQFSQMSFTDNGSDGLKPGGDAVIRHCIADGNGLEGFGGGANDYECTFDSCTAVGNGDDGFDVYSRCRLLNCDANANNNDGFDVTFQCTTINCTADFNGQNGIDMDFTGCEAVDCVCDDNYNYGFLVGDHCLLRNCTATYNQSDGINSLPGTTIESSVAGFNSGSGIYTADDCVLSSCAADTNCGNGFNVSDDCVLSSCTADTNSLDNIVTGCGCVLDHCSAGYSVTGNGFTLGSGNTITGSSALGNGVSSVVGILAANGCSIKDCVATGNSLNGIVVSNACYVEQNICKANGSGNLTDGGILCNGCETRIEGNHLTDNRGNGLYLATTNNTVVCNSAKGNTAANYSVGTGNDIGPIGSAATSTSPWANLQ